MILAVTFRTVLVIINVLAVVVIVGVIGYKVLSVRREPVEKPAQNLTPFLDDQELEGRHLERVLRWALLFSTIVAVVLPLYWLLEPGRQTAEAQGFDERAIERGATLFANNQMDGVRQHQVAAVRQLPRHRRRWRLGELHDHARRPGRPQRPTGPGRVAGAGAQHRDVPLQRVHPRGRRSRRRTTAFGPSSR